MIGSGRFCHVPRMQVAQKKLTSQCEQSAGQRQATRLIKSSSIAHQLLEGSSDAQLIGEYSSFFYEILGVSYHNEIMKTYENCRHNVASAFVVENR